MLGLINDHANACLSLYIPTSSEWAELDPLKVMGGNLCNRGFNSPLVMQIGKPQDIPK